MRARVGDSVLIFASVMLSHKHTLHTSQPQRQYGSNTGYTWTFRGSTNLGVGEKNTFFVVGVKKCVYGKKHADGHFWRRDRESSPVGRECLHVCREFSPVDSGRVRLTPTFNKKGRREKDAQSHQKAIRSEKAQMWSM